MKKYLPIFMFVFFVLVMVPSFLLVGAILTRNHEKAYEVQLQAQRDEMWTIDEEEADRVFQDIKSETDKTIAQIGELTAEELRDALIDPIGSLQEKAGIDVNSMTDNFKK